MFKHLFNIKYVPIGLLILCFAAYGLLIQSLGFYWDDWPLVWVSHNFGPAGFFETFSTDRPFLAGIYFITTSLIKSIPLQWQIMAIFCRWLTAFALWWTLNKLWPNHPEQVTWIAMLFTIYPGFKQMPISVVYCNGLLLFTLYILSLGLMVQAIRKPNKYWQYTIPSLICYSFCTFSTEYYAGLDLIRPIFIWLVLLERLQNIRKRSLQLLIQWLPYISIMILFFIWRVIIFEFPTYQPILVDKITTNPQTGILEFIDGIAQDIITTGWSAWKEIIKFPTLADFQQLSTSLYWFTIIISIPIVGIYLKNLYLSDNNHQNDTNISMDRWPKQAMTVGILALLFAGAPFWLADLQILLNFPYDRFTLAFMIGSCLLLVGIIDWALRTHAQKVIILSLLIGFSIGAHLQNSNSFRREWMTHNDFFWQLFWRAPGLEPGTSVITHALPLSYYSDNSLTAPLNWIYAPGNDSKDLAYLMSYTSIRLGKSLPALIEGMLIMQKYRSANFKSSTSKSLVLFYSPPSCLRVLDPKRDHDLYIFPIELEEAMVISHPEQIIMEPTSPAHLTKEIFGVEPPHTWCYYYQKADLARQRGDWQKVVEFGDEAFRNRYWPTEITELLPFIEGYANVERWDRALDLIREVNNWAPKTQPKLCQILTQLEGSTPLGKESQTDLVKTRELLLCPSQ